MKRYLFLPIVLCILVTAISAQQNPANLGPSINTSFEETAPLISPDGKSLYFVRTGDPKNNGRTDEADIWLSQKMRDGSWARAVNAGAPLNNRLANRVVGIVPNGHHLYLINSYRSNSSQLAISERVGRIWSFPIKVDIDSVTNQQTDVDFHLNSWGNIMLISMARNDAIGNRDLYVSIKKQDNSWSRPKHMGNVLNTKGDESYVFLALDGKTIYFSSNGHKGLGGMDLFMSKRLDDTWASWSTPKNLGAPINNKSDNKFISLPAAGQPAFISLKTAEQKEDLFSVPLAEEFRPEPVVLVHGRLVKMGDDLTQVLDGPAEVINLNAPQASSPLAQRNQSFQLVVPYGEEVNLHAQVDGYYPVTPSLAFGEAEDKKSLDFDSRNLLGSSNFSLSYYQREDEIMALSQQLTELENEIIELKKARNSHRERLAERRDQTPVALSKMDPALLALKLKYTAELSNFRDTIPTNASTQTTRPDKELEELKKRYRSYYKLDKKGKTSLFRNTEVDERFQQMKDSIALNLKIALQPKVQEDLKKEWEAEIRKEVVEQVDLPAKKYLSEETQAWEKHLQNNLKGKDITPKGVPNPQAGEKASWEKQLEAEIQKVLQPDIEAGLRKEMEEDVKDALRDEALYFAKQKRAEDVEAALRQRILHQIKEEERQTERVGNIPNSYEDRLAPPEAPTYKEVEQDLLLVPATVGQTITLHQIQFNPNTAQFKTKSYTELERVVLFLQENNTIKIEIAAHTNGWLSHSQSMQLSKQRAQAIANYLTNHGIVDDRVSYKGYGKIKPLASNDTVEGRRKNQRIEMKVLE